jgi:hypothetical protein
MFAPSAIHFPSCSEKPIHPLAIPMNKVKSIFVGAGGLRHGWRFLLFAAAILAVRFLDLQPTMAWLEAKFHVDRNALSAPSIIIGDGFDLMVILIVTGMFALCERRRIDSYGLPINEAFGGLFGMAWS